MLIISRGTASLNANGFYFFVFSASIYFAHQSVLTKHFQTLNSFRNLDCCSSA